MMNITSGGIDISVLEQLKALIIEQFSIPNNPLIILGKKNSRHLLPEFIPDELFLGLFKGFSRSWFQPYYAGIDGFFTISEKQPQGLEVDIHTDRDAYKWPVQVKALTAWIPLTKISPSKSPGLIFENGIPEMNAGDYIIFDCDELHGTYCSDRQTEIRYSIDFRLLDKDFSPVPPANARISVWPFDTIQRVNGSESWMTTYD